MAFMIAYAGRPLAFGLSSGKNTAELQHKSVTSTVVHPATSDKGRKGRVGNLCSCSA